MEIILRKARYTDCEDILRWRNDRQTRKASFNHKIITYRRHLAWFKKLLSDANRCIYIAEDFKKHKHGFLRFDRLGKGIAEISISLAPLSRDKGLGTSLLKKGCRKFIRDNGKTLFITRVKAKNLASLGFFKKSGFQEILPYRDKKSGSAALLLVSKNA